MQFKMTFTAVNIKSMQFRRTFTAVDIEQFSNQNYYDSYRYKTCNRIFQSRYATAVIGMHCYPGNILLVFPPKCSLMIPMECPLISFDILFL